MSNETYGKYDNYYGNYGNSYLPPKLIDQARRDDERDAAAAAEQERRDLLTAEERKNENNIRQNEQDIAYKQAYEKQIEKVDGIDKKVVESYMSKNYERVKDINTLKPGQVYYIIKKQDNGIRKPVRYICPEKGQKCTICPENSEEVCELWKKTTWGSLTGESAEKYKPYTFDQYKKYIGLGLIDKDDGKHRDDGYYPNGIRIYNGRIIDPSRGGKTKRKHCKTKRKHCKTKRKHCKTKRKQSRRKGKCSKTRRHYKK